MTRPAEHSHRTGSSTISSAGSPGRHVTRRALLSPWAVVLLMLTYGPRDSAHAARLVLPRGAGGAAAGAGASPLPAGPRGASRRFPNPPDAWTPPMGWNPYNNFSQDVSETLLRSIADALVSTGLRDAGYVFLNVDDSWMAKTRDSSGALYSNPASFGSGMKSLADYAHGQGLYFGLYLDSGSKTCAGLPGSKGYEKKDADTIASWGINFMKYDNCGNSLASSASQRYSTMGAALNSTGSTVIFSACNWGQQSVQNWAWQAGCSMWRTSLDISCSWSSFMSKASSQNSFWTKARPGAWNDPDMLEVGNCMKESEDRVHFSLWSIIKAPLIISTDVRKMSPLALNILKNADVIAINQDSLGVQARRVTSASNYEVWSGPLSGGRQVVGIINKSTSTQTPQVDLSNLQLSWLKQVYTINDVWKKMTTQASSPVLRPTIPGHDIFLAVLCPGTSCP